jgi:ECF transporter S component (folate family)
MNQNSLNTRKLVLTSMFAALTLLATYIIKIQTPTFGYIHLGDAFVLLSGFFLGPALGGLAAGIGSALSDLLGGYAVWVPGTFVIKFLTAFVAALVFGAISKRGSRRTLRTPAIVVSGVIGELIMVTGYFFYNVIIIGATGGGFGSAGIGAAFSASFAEIPFNLVQGAAGIILSTALEPVFTRIGHTAAWSEA